MLESLGKTGFQTAVNTGMSLAIDDMVHDRNVQDAKNAEIRAQHYWQKRFDIMNDYNSPQAVAERYRQAGLNPASAFGGGAVGQALDPSVNPNTPNSTRGPQASPLDLLGAEQSLANIRLTEAQADNIAVDTMNKKGDLAIKQLEINAREQLLDYNAEQFPLLIKQLNEAIRTLHNQGSNYEASTINLEASAILITFQAMREKFGLNLDQTKLDIMRQDLATGALNQEYLRWKIKHEEALVKLANIEGGIKQATFEQVYATGLFGQLQEAELKNKKAQWDALQADLQKMYNLGFFPQGVTGNGLSTGEASPYTAGFGEFTTPTEGLWYFLATEFI